MLSSKQMKALELMFETPRPKDGEIAEMIGVTPKTISVWKNQNEEFQNEYRKIMNRKLLYATSKAFDRQVSLLYSENDMVAYLASKDLMDRGGFVATTKVEGSMDMGVSIIKDDIPDEDD